MKRNVKIIVAVVLTALISVSSLVLFFTNPSNDRADQIIIGGPRLEQNALIYVADAEGFFTKNGINVTIHDDYPNGVGPVRDMSEGVLDMSVSAEYPVIGRIFSGSNVSIVATIDKYQNEKLIARRDLGVHEVADLKGKTIGLPRGTILEFFLGRFLELNKMSISDVTLVDVEAIHATDAIANGEVDAIAYFQPYVTEIEQRLGDDGIAWPMQSNQLLYGVIAARGDWIAHHQAELEQFLRSLEEARVYALTHPGETQAIVKNRMHLTDDYLAAVWDDHQFTLALDQSLLVAMNDEGRWMIINNLTAEKTVPDFRRNIHTLALERVSPELVNIR
jgi:NitT/TauT family transport system substrate-binding protein